VDRKRPFFFFFFSSSFPSLLHSVGCAPVSGISIRAVRRSGPDSGDQSRRKHCHTFFFSFLPFPPLLPHSRADRRYADHIVSISAETTLRPFFFFPPPFPSLPLSALAAEAVRSNYLSRSPFFFFLSPIFFLFFFLPRCPGLRKSFRNSGLRPPGREVQTATDDRSFFLPFPLPFLLFFPPLRTRLDSSSATTEDYMQRVTEEESPFFPLLFSSFSPPATR